MSEIFVIGHRNPDTDAICSAIGYAEFKRRTGMPEAVAARCGDTNDRIDFVLETFGVPPPLFVADVSPKVSDVMQRDIMSVSPDAIAWSMRPRSCSSAARLSASMRLAAHAVAAPSISRRTLRKSVNRSRVIGGTPMLRPETTVSAFEAISRLSASRTGMALTPNASARSSARHTSTRRS